jgi:O-Antigen ligase
VLAAGPDRLAVAAAALAGVLGALAPLVLGVTLHALTGDQVPLHTRSGAGALFALALIAGIAVALAAARVLERRLPALGPVRLPPLATRRRNMAIAASVVVLVAGFGLAEAGVGGSISQGFESFKSVKFERQNDPARILQTNSGNRWVWWNEALGAWSSRPLSGWGAGSFPLLHLRYRHNRLEVLQPHSVPLEWLAELGLVGALLALGALASLALAGLRHVTALTRGLAAGAVAGPDLRYSSALVAAVAGWLVHMWFDWDWDIPGVTLPLMVFLGVLAGRPVGMPALTLARGGTTAAGARAAALALGALLACAVAVSAALPSLAAGRLDRARAAVASDDFAAAWHDADVATKLDPLGVEPLLLQARVAGRQARFPDAAAVLDEALRRQPDNPDVWFAVARFDLARGDIPALLQASHTMLRLDPVGSLGRFFYYAADLGVRSATATGTPLAP